MTYKVTSGLTENITVDMVFQFAQKMTDQVMFRNNQNAQESIITQFNSK